MTSSPMRYCCSSAASTTGPPSRSTEGLNDPQLPRLLPKAALAKLREEVEMAKGLCPTFDLKAYREAHLTPVYFGSALNNFGVRELLRGVGELAPAPRPMSRARRRFRRRLLTNLPQDLR
jgi:peptide subunit release factor RF-3